MIFLSCIAHTALVSPNPFLLSKGEETQVPTPPEVSELRVVALATGPLVKVSHDSHLLYCDQCP